MKIRIIPKNHFPIAFTIPNSLIFNNITKLIIINSIKHNQGYFQNLDVTKFNILFNALKDCFKEYKNLELVDIESADGTCVKIRF